MATTFDGALTSGEGLQWRCYFTIDGLPHVFGMSAADSAVFEAAANRVHVPAIEGWPEFSGDELDYAQRRIIGGTFSCTLLDDVAGTLRNLFTPRRRRSTWVAANVTTASATLQVNSAAWASGPTVFYVDGETMIGTPSGPSMITLTRGAFGSPSQQHFGGTEQGAGVFLTPPAWAGRRIRVFAYLVDSQGLVTTARRQQLGVWRLKGAPVNANVVQWRIEGEPLADDFAKRKIGEGAADDEAFFNVVSAAFPYHVTIMAAGPQWSTLSDVASRMLLRRDDRWKLARVTSSSPVGPVGRFTLGATEAGGVGDETGNPTARHVCVLDDFRSDTRAIGVIVSTTGTGTGQLLPGFEPVSYGGAGFRMGAGVPIAEVDTASFTDALVATPPWSLVVDDVIPLGDFLADLAFCAGAFWGVSRSGQLQLRRLGESRATSVLTLTESNTRGSSLVEYDDAAIAPRIRLKCNYNAIGQEYDVTVDVVDEELARAYPGREDAVEITTRLLQIEPGRSGPLGGITLPTCTRGQVETALRRYQVANGRGRLLVTRDCSHDAAVLVVGDAVRIDFDTADLEGGSIRNRLGRVVRWRPDIARGVYVVTIEVLDTLFAVAPAAIVAAVTDLGGGFYLLGLSTSAPENGGSTTPGLFFAVGQLGALLSLATNVVDASAILALTSTSVTMKTTLVPAIGDVVTVATSGWTDTTSVNSAGLTPADYTYLQGNALQTFVTRWR